MRQLPGSEFASVVSRGDWTSGFPSITGLAKSVEKAIRCGQPVGRLSLAYRETLCRHLLLATMMVFLKSLSASVGPVVLFNRRGFQRLLRALQQSLEQHDNT